MHIHLTAREARPCDTLLFKTLGSFWGMIPSLIHIDQRQSPKEPESGPAKQNFEWITEMKKWINEEMD